MDRIEINVMTGERSVISLTAEEIAALPPAPESPRQIRKADLWRRATDQEAVTIDGLLTAQPVRLQRMWQDAMFLSTDDELYPAIEGALVTAFGAARAAELLA